MLCHTCGGKGHFKRDCPNRKVMFINEDNETGDDVDPNAPDNDDYDTDGEDAYPSDARTIVVSRRALNVLPSASTQRCNLFQTKALVGPDKACKESHAGGLMGHFGREKTLLMLADHFYWPKMRRDVDRYVKRCITCNKSKSKLKPHDTSKGTKLRLLVILKRWSRGGELNLVTTLRSMIKKNRRSGKSVCRMWSLLTTGWYILPLCPFEVVYGFKPITPLDLLPLPIHERVNMEASKRADFVRKIHVKTKELIEKKGKSNAARMNKKRKEMLFKPGDMVWINDNAYSIDLPVDEFGVSNSFNVADLTPYDGEDLGASGSTPFEGGDDEDIPTSLLPPSLTNEDEPAVKLKYQEETSIARGEEQLDMKTDVKMAVKLDMELDMKISHGRAREGRNAREEKKKSGPVQNRRWAVSEMGLKDYAWRISEAA
ncbi:hypothetical protein QYE76_058358 [Lolium multiflorum]|uniref:CCHC-type domain-containing protein n=1 Tax=Lolium multiflorum TaxID=4521 RepID=A0AAD8T6F2_LOLMU|nr:hypothetical protein QYE76_058358 [Lolium multiflorum]